jgi:hypothetical protein
LRNWPSLLVLVVALAIVGPVTAQGKRLTDSQLRNMGYVELPALKQREVLGVWVDTIAGPPRSGCTRSIHGVGSRYYEVLGCGGPDSDRWGKEIDRVNRTVFRPRDSRAGTTYTIDSYGRLVVSDRDGLTLAHAGAS